MHWCRKINTQRHSSLELTQKVLVSFDQCALRSGHSEVGLRPFLRALKKISTKGGFIIGRFFQDFPKFLSDFLPPIMRRRVVGYFNIAPEGASGDVLGEGSQVRGGKCGKLNPKSHKKRT